LEGRSTGSACHNTAVGEFAGILGWIALIIGEPVVLVMLLADVIIWLIKRER
jgi:type III secretory pathway component EscT